MAAAVGSRCAAIAASLRIRLGESPLNIRRKPDTAPKNFISPATIKSVLDTGPIEQLLFCACDACAKYSGLSADERKIRYGDIELAEKYVSLFALLLALNCAGLFWWFQNKGVGTLDQPISEKTLDSLTSFLTDHFTNDEAKDVRNRIGDLQYSFFARPLEIGKIDIEYHPKEALPIDEDDNPKGEGSYGEVYAFKILDEYRGDGYKAFKVMLLEILETL